MRAPRTMLELFKSGLDEYLVKLVALRSFFDASEEVTRREFELLHQAVPGWSSRWDFGLLMDTEGQA